MGGMCGVFACAAFFFMIPRGVRSFLFRLWRPICICFRIFVDYIHSNDLRLNPTHSWSAKRCMSFDMCQS